MAGGPREAAKTAAKVAAHVNERTPACCGQERSRGDVDEEERSAGAGNRGSELVSSTRACPVSLTR